MSPIKNQMEVEKILKGLIEGNKNYAAGCRVEVDHQKDAKCSAEPQFPEAVIVSCLDSRVPVEQIFNKCVGELFVARIAGNVMNDDIVGSLEFAVLATDVKLVIILGHTSCGAVKGCCQGVKLGSLTQLLAKIKPALKTAQLEMDDDVDTSSAQFIDRVAEINAQLSAEQFISASPLVAEKITTGEVKVVSAIYDLETQLVKLID